MSPFDPPKSIIKPSAKGNIGKKRTFIIPSSDVSHILLFSTVCNESPLKIEVRVKTN